MGEKKKGDKVTMVQIFLRKVDGQLACLQLDESATVSDLREMACAEGVDSESLRLVAGGADLEDELVLSECLEQDATVEALVRLPGGGGKKRKKKNYTKLKRMPHKHKKVPLATLKFYKVDGQGKIVRLRRECTRPICGPGVFMANHFDRHYCGKCQRTYKFVKGEKDEKRANSKMQRF